MMRKVKIIFVCTGNTCRSPMAEAYFKTISKDYDVESAGMATFGGDAVSENSVEVMSEIGVEIKGKLSAPLTHQMVNDADYIICLADTHYNSLLPIVPKDKLVLLGKGISDPYGQDIDAYRKARDEIVDSCNKLVEEIELRNENRKFK